MIQTALALDIMRYHKLWHASGVIACSQLIISQGPILSMDHVEVHAARSLLTQPQRLQPIWDRGLAPSLSRCLSPSWKLGGRIKVSQPPPLQVQHRDTYLPGQESSPSLCRPHQPASVQRASWPKVLPVTNSELQQELTKWQQLIATIGVEHSQLARKLVGMSTDDKRMETLKATFHGPHETMRKHSGSINLYVRWCHSSCVIPFPLTEDKIFEYIASLDRTRAAPTRADTFIRA